MPRTASLLYRREKAPSWASAPGRHWPELIGVSRQQRCCELRYALLTDESCAVDFNSTVSSLNTLERKRPWKRSRHHRQRRRRAESWPASRTLSRQTRLACAVCDGALRRFRNRRWSSWAAAIPRSRGVVLTKVRHPRVLGMQPPRPAAASKIPAGAGTGTTPRSDDEMEPRRARNWPATRITGVNWSAPQETRPGSHARRTGKPRNVRRHWPHAEHRISSAGRLR